LILDGLAFVETFKGAFGKRLEGCSLFLVRVAVAACGRPNGAACLGGSFAVD